MEPTAAPPRVKDKAEYSELTVEHGKEQHGKGPVGSLANPEVYENIPGSVIPILREEFADFDVEADRFLDGQIPEDEFIGFRLKQGVYGQRQADVQMMRIKLPFGGVTPDQMDAFADVVERWAPLRKGHITTRQNIQIHHVPLADVKDALKVLGDAGLSSREGCGNTVRNVTGDPYAGIHPDEVFDPSTYAAAYTRYFVRHPTTQLMPRKIKTAFSASDADRAITKIHDIAFLPRIRDGVRGFELLVGGGTSIMPRLAQTVTEFTSADDGEYLKYSEAVLRIFDRQQWLRPNRARARIKVLVDKIGIERFRELVEEELEGDWVNERDFTVDHLRFDVDEQATAPPRADFYGSPNGDRSEFDAWVDSNVSSQRQEGFVAAEINVYRGDLTPEQFRGIAEIMRRYCGGHARTTIEQNIVMRWIRPEALYDVYSELQTLDLHAPGASQITDVVSCPGTDSCKLGITSSMGLNAAVREKLDEIGTSDELTKKIHIKMSGCPNGCGQHHIANIGFYGASIKVGEHTLPAYIPHIAGNFEGGDVVFGQRLKVRLPAKRVPAAIERWVKMYEAERAEGEDFNAYAGRVGTERFEDAVGDLTMPIDFSLENMSHFIDWQRSDPYEVIRGEGECAV